MANNTQAFADQMTANILRCREHDVKQVVAKTGATAEAAREAIKLHGCKWLAIDALRHAA
jgi:NACalpha-BTF3-like transcription factor